ncbi:MAG TPA: CAP domain-containing protein [Pyrinomonadaceae bacterium]|nr:CAP domain-containing protein [Pyrinomonadaceae bacterium]
MNSERFITSRRSFIESAAPFVLALPAFVHAQTLIERGGFNEEQFPLVREKLLKLLNDERAEARLNPLALDELAGKVGNDHASDMVHGQFLSHWGSDGRKAYHRYSFAGGTDALQENVGSADNIQSLAPNSVIKDFLDMHQAMMNEVPPNDGHRRTILNPHHTHVGFGMSFQGHSLRLDELYLARYIQLDHVPRQAKAKSTIIFTGKLLNARHFLHEVDVFYEPLPTAPDIAWLRAPRSLSLPDDYVVLRPKAPGGTTYVDGTLGDFDWGGGRFRVPAKMYKDEPGIYTIVFWINRNANENPFPVAEVCVRVE